VRGHVSVQVTQTAGGGGAVVAGVFFDGGTGNAPPSVTLTAPAEGASYAAPAAIALTATATDGDGIGRVEFYQAAALGQPTLIGPAVTSPPYSIGWNNVAAGSYTLTAKAYDTLGVAATSAGVHVTVFNDVTPPVISAVMASAILSSSATISWITNEWSNSEVEYGLTTAYGGFSTLDVTLATTHSIVLGDLAPSTQYHFRARSRVVAGNLALSGDFTFTTLDGIPPSVSITAPATGSTVSGTVTVAANATDNGGVAGVQFQLDGAPLGAEDTTSPFAVAWDTTARAGGLHTLTAVARDAAGNRTTSASVSVTVANSTGQVTLAWDASVDPSVTGYKVHIGTTSGVYTVSVVDVGNVISGTISGLQAGTVYYFAVTGYDQNGNESGFSNEVSTTIQ